MVAFSRRFGPCNGMRDAVAAPCAAPGLGLWAPRAGARCSTSSLGKGLVMDAAIGDDNTILDSCSLMYSFPWWGKVSCHHNMAAMYTCAWMCAHVQ